MFCVGVSLLTPLLHQLIKGLTLQRTINAKPRALLDEMHDATKHNLPLKCPLLALLILGAAACSAEQPDDWVDDMGTIEAYILPKLKTEIKMGLESRAEIRGCLENAPDVFTREERELLTTFSDYTGTQVQDAVMRLVAESPEEMRLSVWSYSKGYLIGNVTASRVYTNENCLGLKEVVLADPELSADDVLEPSRD